MIISALVWTISNLHQPITPLYFTSLNLPDHIFGTSYACMVFALFLASPIWGSIGDKGHRKKSLVISIFLYGLVKICLSLVSSMGGILFIRLCAGAVAAGFQVGLMAALVDVSKEEEKKVIMANYTAILSLGVAMGFFLGGILGYLPPTLAFKIQGGLMILLSVFVSITLKETNAHALGDETRKTKFVWDIIKDVKMSPQVFDFWILIFLSITFLVGFSHSGNTNALSYYLKAELNMRPIVNGIFKAGVGIVGLVANMLVNTWLIRKTSLKRSMVYILFLYFIFGIFFF